MIILGIDPGTVRAGYGVVRKTDALRLVACGVVGDESKGSMERLAHIGKSLQALIKRHKPDVVGIEKLYFSKNKKTALAVAEARGVIVFTAARAGLPVLEFSPTDIKSVVAGDGRCDKRALRKIVAMTLGEKDIDGPDDVSDALAVAIRTSFEYTE